MKGNLICATLLGAALLFAATGVRAGTYEVNYGGIDDPSVNGDLIITTTDSPAGGPSTVTTISGERDGASVTGLSTYAASDQYLFASDSWFDFSGLSFSTEGTGDFNLFANDGRYYEVSSFVSPIGDYTSGSEIRLSVTAIPEPASVGILGLGVIALGLSRRSKMRSVRDAVPRDNAFVHVPIRNA